VTKQKDGRYEGELRTLSVRAPISIVPIADKSAENKPDFRVDSNGAELGAGWARTSQRTGNEYISLSLAAPELGPKTLYANLVRANGADEVYHLIWNPAD
jgi:uncharacterized protein (DUF736 family)